MTRQIDARGNKIEFSYDDELGRVTEKRIYNSSQQLVDTITYHYDHSDDEEYTVHKGQIYKITDGQGWTKTGYDSRGRAIKTTRYIEETDLNYTTHSSYDIASRITQITYPGNVATIGYSYDSAGNLTKVESLWGTGANEVFYQAQGFNEQGQLIGSGYGNGVTTEYDYYENSKQLKQIHTYKGTTDIQNITYTFDKVSNVKSITDSVYTGSASCGLSNVQYDDLHRLTYLNSVAQGEVSYSYNAIGNILTNGEFGTGTYQYNGSGHTHSQPHAVTSANGKSYSYDACGNMTTRGDQTLSYGEQNQLIQVQTTGNTVQFGYSEGGTRLWKKTNDQIRQLWIGSIYEEKYDSAQSKMVKLCHVFAGDQLIATFEPESTWACLIQNEPFLASVYNFSSRMIEGLFGNGKAPVSMILIFALAGLACGLYYNRRRLWLQYGLTSPSRMNAFYRRNPWRQMILLTMTGSIILAGLPIQAYAGNPENRPIFYYYHADHLGSSQIMTDRDGDIIQHYGYSAFGNEYYRNNTQAFSISHHYTGQMLDEDTGLYYYGARYYDPELGRFIQPDSVVPKEFNSQALNRYSYCINNPLKFTDPTGQFFDLVFNAALWIISKFSVEAAITAAVVNAGIAAATGGNIWKAALSGFISGGLAGGFGFPGAVAGGAIGAAIQGGDPVMGATTAGISAGVASCFGETLLPSVFKDLEDNFFNNLLLSTATGSLAGGVTSEIFGGSFGEGVARGAASAAAGYVIGKTIAVHMEKMEKKIVAAFKSSVDIAKKVVNFGLPITKKVIDVGLSVVGKIWNSPNTAIGLTYGLAGIPLGGGLPVLATAGIHFPNSPFQPVDTAFTLGNVAIYGKGHYFNPFPDYVDHETQHMLQGEILGPFYLPLHIIDKAYNLSWSKGWLEEGPYSNPPRPWPW